MCCALKVRPVAKWVLYCSVVLRHVTHKKKKTEQMTAIGRGGGGGGGGEGILLSFLFWTWD